MVKNCWTNFFTENALAESIKFSMKLLSLGNSSSSLWSTTSDIIATSFPQNGHDILKD